MDNYSVLFGKKLAGGGGGGSATLIDKDITANGTYNARSDNADGFRKVVVGVPNTYTLADEGKVVDSGALEAQTSKSINANGTYDTTLNNEVVVAVPNSYTQSDEGKVVSQGTLVAQTTYPSTVTQNGTIDTTLNNSVTINVPPVGVVEKKDVNFYDYDGTIVYSYTAQEFLALSELPANPTHTGLTAQGWNWSLADAKSYVEQFIFNSIGQCYVTSDGKTRLYITIPTDNCPIRIYTAAVDTYDATVDWGDGTTNNITTATTDHTYTVSGDYVITITVNDGCVLTLGNSTYAVLMDSRYLRTSYPQGYNTYLTKAEIGVNVVFGSAFKYCSELKCVTMPNTIRTFGDYFFNAAHSLECVIIPNGVTTLPAYSIQNCDHLKCISLSSTITTFGERAINANGECNLCLPPNVSSFGSYSVSYGEFDNIVLASGNPSTTTVTSLIGRYTTVVNTAVFSNFGDITGVAKGLRLILTNNVTTISTDALLSKRYDKVIIPDSVTTCSSVITDSPYLIELTIGSGLSTLPQIGGGYYASASLVNLRKLIFRRTTPPTCSNASKFSIPTGCVIYVPTGSLSAYTSASNYPSSSTYSYVEYNP